MTKNRALSEREIEIQNCVWSNWGTRLSIARELGLSKHPALMRLIEAMVRDGILERHLSETNKGTPVFYYRAKGTNE